jgi:3-hydroxyisobutyryl-CoA hydrolase
MGGGVGISIHGRYRVATEHTLFAMPETAIGLFPDVGSMFWMPRLLSKPVANYLALTGQRIRGPDLVYTGLATHYIPSAQLPELELALIKASSKSSQQPEESDDVKEEEEDVVASVLKDFHVPIPTNDCHLAHYKDAIDQSFQADSVEGILDNLRNDQSEFATNTLAKLLKLSPTSLKVSLEGLKRGAACATIGDDLQMEYRMAKACIRPGSDFYEGVRAVLVDKDHSPQWNPATVEEVTDERVEEFFAPINHEWPIPVSKL